MTLDVYGHLMPNELDMQADRLDTIRSGAAADSLRTLEGGGDVAEIGSRL
jgi:hypothetical protein